MTIRIGLIAMSGVRADSDELNRAGLTFPGIMERGQVIASLPSLSLLTLAALTPPDVEVEYHEIRDLRAEGLPAGRFDLVAISTLSAQVLDGYEVARRYRDAGVPAVMGGLHVTARPEEALRHCTAVVVGEGEPVWPRLVEDFRRGRLQERYEAGPGEELDLADAPVPRYDLLDLDKYNRLTVQTARGCPHRCDFCASSILLTRRYKRKPVGNIARELQAIKRLWRRPFIELADDNSFVDRRHAREVLAALARERVRWFTEADVSIAEDEPLLELMRASGCRQVLIGLESPSASGLAGVELHSDWKLKQVDRYETAVRRIQAHGITVNGCFVLGLDGDTEAVFDEIGDFVERTDLYDVQITVLTPFPGTPLYDRLLAEGRIIEPEAWNKCTLFDVNFHPRHMSAERLQRGLLELAGRVYDPQLTRQRRERFFRRLDRRGVVSPMPRRRAV